MEHNCLLQLGFFCQFSSEWLPSESVLLDRPLSWHPSPPPFFYLLLFMLPSLSIRALRTPSMPIQFTPHVKGQCIPTKINQPLNGRIFVCVHTPPAVFLFPSHLLVPYRWEQAPFTMSPTPLEWTSQGPRSPILCLIALLLDGESTPQNHLWGHRRKLTGFCVKTHWRISKITCWSNKRKGFGFPWCYVHTGLGDTRSSNRSQWQVKVLECTFHARFTHSKLLHSCVATQVFKSVFGCGNEHWTCIKS